MVTIPSQGSFDSGTGIWSLGGLSSSANATLDITVSVDQSGTITNTAEVTAVDQADPDSTPGDGLGDDYDTVDVIVQQADLELTKSVDNSTPNLGDIINFTIIVTNFGPDNATGVIFTDTIPTSMTYVSAAPSQGTCSGTTTIICNLGGLANGVSANIIIAVRMTAIGAADNIASVLANEFDPILANNTAAVSVNITAPELPDTGFAPGLFTRLPHHTNEMVYRDLGNLWL